MVTRNDLKPQDQAKPTATAVATTAPKGVSSFESFVQEFDAPGRQREITAMLPENVPFERFRSCAIAAVKQNPDILSATPRSIFNALTKAAQDGLLPDGREGFINVYNTKQKVGDKDVWLPTAQWLPMTFGIRKRARELDKMIIDAQVVCMNDTFEWHQGDDPKIVHTPVQLGQGERGEKVGAYAIFKREDGTILHREVMDLVEIEKAKKQSKSPGGLLWTTFSEEAFRKTAVRRGSKTVPVSDGLRQIIQRDDDLYEFNRDPAGEPGAAIAIPPRPKQSDFDRGTNRVTGELTKPEAAASLAKDVKTSATDEPISHDTGHDGPASIDQGGQPDPEVSDEEIERAIAEEEEAAAGPKWTPELDRWYDATVAKVESNNVVGDIAKILNLAMATELKGFPEQLGAFMSICKRRQKHLVDKQKAEKAAKK